jgi:hypothetical protein
MYDVKYPWALLVNDNLVVIIGQLFTWFWAAFSKVQKNIIFNTSVAHISFTLSDLVV